MDRQKHSNDLKFSERKIFTDTLKQLPAFIRQYANLILMLKFGGVGTSWLLLWQNPTLVSCFPVRTLINYILLYAILIVSKSLSHGILDLLIKTNFHDIISVYEHVFFSLRFTKITYSFIPLIHWLFFFIYVYIFSRKYYF